MIFWIYTDQTQVQHNFHSTFLNVGSIYDNDYSPLSVHFNFYKMTGRRNPILRTDKIIPFSIFTNMKSPAEGHLAALPKQKNRLFPLFLTKLPCTFGWNWLWTVSGKCIRVSNGIIYPLFSLLISFKSFKVGILLTFSLFIIYSRWKFFRGFESRIIYSLRWIFERFQRSDVWGVYSLI